MRIVRENIIHVVPPPADTPLAIVLAGESFCDESYHIARADTPKAVLEYVISGSGSLIVDGEYFKPQGGDVYLIPPNSRHYYISDAATPWHKLWFNVAGPLLRPLLSAYHLEDQILFRNCPMREPFEEGLNLLRRQQLPPEIVAPRILVPILAGLWRHLEESRTHADPASLKEFIAGQPGVKLSLKELSAQSGRSVSQTIRIFRKKFQTTPYAENLANRLSAAANLLANSDEPVKEIALSLGFSDPYYFSRIFRRKTGETPTAYRNRMKSVKGERSGYVSPQDL